MGRRQLHPALLVHPAHISGSRRLIAQASAGRPPLILKDPRALSALAALPGEFDRDDALAAWREAGIPDEAGAGLWEALDSAGLLADADGDQDWWAELGWLEAGTYHRATRDYPFLQMDQPGALAEDTRRMHAYSSEPSRPSPYQHVDADTVVELPRLGRDRSPDDWLASLSDAERRGREGIGLLLDVCFGERGQMVVAGGTRALMKSIPSGGARHPTEVFIAAFEIPDVPAGTYHYDVEHHRLELVRGGDHLEQFEHASFDLFSRLRAAPAALFVFTSLVERAMWRYRDPRSFRAVMVDVGHAVASFRHVARALGFRTFSYQRMRDSEVASLIGVDRVRQPPLYLGTLVP